MLISSVLVTFLVVSLAMYDKFSGYMQEDVREEIQYIKVAVEESQGDDLLEKMGEFTGSSRITLMQEDGTVIFDSVEDSQMLENHRNRPEFEEALEKGYGEAIRYSETLAKQTFYCAVTLKDGRVLRLARSTDTVLIFLESSITLVGILVFVIIIVAFFVVQKQTNRLIEPINKLDLEHPLREVKYEELRPLLMRVHEQNKQIARQVQELKERHEEYIAITENMKDGLVIASQTEVLSINRAAQKVFQVRASDCIRKSISRVSRNQELRKALDQALAGEYNETVLQIRGRTYQLLANPVRISGKTFGAVILVWDITEKNAAEKMRREFSANVSHELKTPLTSISGYAEIMMNGLVRAEDIPGFSKRIYKEARRLITLVEDIIKLSKLDEESVELEKEDVELYELTREIVSRLSPQCSEKKISVALSGEPVFCHGIRQILDEMIYNITENAIKYNRDGGSVSVWVGNTLDGPKISVSDTGIGIPEEHQERIFERFYRVDKSHSKERGGTGLGLSIVKHGAILHGAKVTVNSEPGKGTKIEIRFPKEEKMKKAEVL